MSLQRSARLKWPLFDYYNKVWDKSEVLGSKQVADVGFQVSVKNLGIKGILSF